MDTIFKLEIKLRYATFDRTDMEFAVVEKVRTATPRPVCTLQIGQIVDMESISLLQQIIDDCVIAAASRTVGVSQALNF